MRFRRAGALRLLLSLCLAVQSGWVPPAAAAGVTGTTAGNETQEQHQLFNQGAIPVTPLAAPKTRFQVFPLPIDERLGGGQGPPTTTGAPATGAPAPSVETVQPAAGAVVPGAQAPQAPPAAPSVPPFGSQLFTEQPQLFGPVAFNRDYIIGPGDQIQIEVWGAYTYTGVQGVDPRGNIFIPQIGPIHVAGATNKELNARIDSAVKRVFTQNVQTYASLLSKQPVAVYVTGAVVHPGRYSGDAQDSPLQYLARAGGIDQKSGSYRDIRIIRGGKTIARLDLYAFLTGNEVPPIQFAVDDTIYVGFQRPTVTAQGDVANAYRFEIDPGRSTGADIIALTRPNPTVSNVSIQGLRSGQPYNAYVGLDAFKRLRLASGDTLNFASDYVSDTIFVNVTGQASGPSSFVVPRGSRLGDVLKLIAVDPRVADLHSIFLRRQSVAQQQQAALEQSLDQLRRSVLTSTSLSTSDAAIHTEEAQLVQAFLQQVQAIRPQGIVVLPDSAARDQIMVEPYDQIVIPTKSDVVLVTGEVRLPQTLVYAPGRALAGYVNEAGGLTDRADTKNFVVLHASGQVETGPPDRIAIRPGDQIMVMPVVDYHQFAVMQDVIQLIYQIAVSTGILVRISKL
jgi:protein involved in polysaccharide export with SLBB domain